MKLLLLQPPKSQNQTTTHLHDFGSAGFQRAPPNHAAEADSMKQRLPFGKKR
jgi:hypothetical protein